MYAQSSISTTLCLDLLSWSAASQAVETQHARPERSDESLQMHLTSSVLQLPKLVPTQLLAQAGKPGMAAAASATRPDNMRRRIVIKCWWWDSEETLRTERDYYCNFDCPYELCAAREIGKQHWRAAEMKHDAQPATDRGPAH